MNSHAQPMWSGVVSANTRGGEMFLRVYRPSEDKEILVNVNSIRMIEVQYAVKREGDRALTMLSTRQGQTNPDAIRVYKIFFGADAVLLKADPDDPAMKIIAKIYNDAVKG
jgi:hypothetical protein